MSRILPMQSIFNKKKILNVNSDKAYKLIKGQRIEISNLRTSKKEVITQMFKQIIIKSVEKYKR